MSHNVIKWPDNQEKLIIEQQFRENGFPNIIGAIDGCHLKIDKPINDPDSYINRKGYHSVQVDRYHNCDCLRICSFFFFVDASCMRQKSEN